MRALRVGLRVGVDGLDRRRARRAPAAIRQLRIVSTVSPTIATSRASVASVSSVTSTEPSSEFSIGTQRRVDDAVLHRHHGVVERRAARPPRGRASARVEQRLVAEGPLGTEVADPHGAQRSPRLRPSARRSASSSSGESCELGGARGDLLGVQARLVAVVDRGQHDPGAVGVEQRDRQRLVARHLVVGVVADQRAVGDRAVEARSARPRRASRRWPTSST